MISNSVKSIQCSPFCFSGVSVRQMLACLPSIQSSRLPHNSIQPLETSQREYVAQGKLNMPKTIKTGRTFAAFVLQHAGCSNSLGACPERTSCTLLSIVCSYGFRSVKPQMTCLVWQLAGALLLVLSFVCVKSIMMSWGQEPSCTHRGSSRFRMYCLGAAQQITTPASSSLRSLALWRFVSPSTDWCQQNQEQQKSTWRGTGDHECHNRCKQLSWAPSPLPFSILTPIAITDHHTIAITIIARISGVIIVTTHHYDLQCLCHDLTCPYPILSSSAGSRWDKIPEIYKRTESYRVLSCGSKINGRREQWGEGLQLLKLLYHDPIYCEHVSEWDPQLQDILFVFKDQVDKTFKPGEVILQEFLTFAFRCFTLNQCTQCTFLCFVSFKDGEVFQTGKSFVYFILKGEVEIWKARHIAELFVRVYLNFHAMQWSCWSGRQLHHATTTGWNVPSQVDDRTCEHLVSQTDLPTFTGSVNLRRFESWVVVRRKFIECQILMPASVANDAPGDRQGQRWSGLQSGASPNWERWKNVQFTQCQNKKNG